jgi:hypothetical protein
VDRNVAGALVRIGRGRRTLSVMRIFLCLFVLAASLGVAELPCAGGERMPRERAERVPALPFQQHAGGRVPRDAELLGTWVYEDSSGRTVYKFASDHRLTVTVPGMPVETRRYQLKGRVVTLGPGSEYEGHFEVGLINDHTLEVVIGPHAARFTRQK